MATTIFFNGRVTAQPGSYSEVDATALAVVGLSAVGRVALVGEVEGGSPYNGATPVHRFTNPGAVGRTFREGDLVEAANIAFDPARDDAIAGGAVEVVAVKVNPSTQSAVTLLDASVADALTLTSSDYGLFTQQINVDVSAGTNKGKAYTIALGADSEVYDDVGGDAIWTASFAQGTNTLTTVTVEVDPDVGITGQWTEVNAGLRFTNQHPGGAEVLRVVSSDPGDTTQSITAYGVDASGDPQTEVIALNGTTPVLGSDLWSANGVLGFILDAATAGNVTIDYSPTTGTVIATITAASLTAGVALVDNAAVQQSTKITVTAASAPGASRFVGIFGFTGQTAKGEIISVPSTTPVLGTDVDWTEVTVIALGAADTGFNWTITANPFVLTTAGYASLGLAVDAINVLAGWTASITAAYRSLLISDLDYKAAVNVISPSVLGTWTADLYAAITALSGSSLVTPTKPSGANSPPDNTAAPVFLIGGVEGTTLFANWQAALDVLRDEDVDTVVLLTSDAAVHAAGLVHAIYCAGAGKRERDIVVGGAASVTKTAAKAAAQVISSRHMRYLFQNLVRYNTQGVRESFPPYMFAAAVAGAQAGSPIGESLTYKFFNALDIEFDSSFVLQDDNEELLQAGLWYLEPVRGRGFRCKRNLTTHLADNNLAYIEASVNEATNYTAKNVRTNLEAMVAKKGFQRTVNQAVSNVVTTLAQLIEDEVITSWRNLTVVLGADTMDVDVEVAPVNPTNFVKTTLHLVSAEFAAAA